VLLVRTTVAGDFSPYVLRLVDSVAQATQSPFEVTDVLPGFDPQLAAFAASVSSSANVPAAYVNAATVQR